MARKILINVRVTIEENALLVKVAKDAGRTKTDVVRALIRSLSKEKHD